MAGLAGSAIRQGILLIPLDSGGVSRAMPDVDPWWGQQASVWLTAWSLNGFDLRRGLHHRGAAPEQIE